MLSKISRLLGGGTALENKKNTHKLIIYIKGKIDYLASFKRADAEQAKLIKEAHLATLNHMLLKGATPNDLYEFAMSLLKLSQEEYAIAKKAYDAYNEKQKEYAAIIEKLSQDLDGSLAKWEKEEFGQSENKEDSESLSRKSSDSDFIDFESDEDQVPENKTESICYLEDFDFTSDDEQLDNQVTIHTHIKKSFHRQYTKESQYSGFFTRVENEEKVPEPVYLEDAELKDFRVVTDPKP